MKMRKNLLAMLLAVVMIAAVVFIAAPNAKAANADPIEAVAANVEGATGFTPIKLTADAIVNLNGLKNVVIDTNGYKVSLIDTGNLDDLSGDAAGTAKVTGTVADWVQHTGGFKYLALENADGTYSAHPFNISITEYGVNTHYSAVSVRVTVIANDKVAKLIDAGEFGLHNYKLKDHEDPEKAAKEYSPYWKSFKDFTNEEGKYTTHGIHGYFYLENSLTSNVLTANASCKLGAYVKINGKIIDSLQLLQVSPQAILTDLNNKALEADTFTDVQKAKMVELIKKTQNEDEQFYFAAYCGNFLKSEGSSSAWTLVTDASTLKVGDQIIIVNKDATYALSTTQASNNRPAVGIADLTALPDAVQLLTLENGNSAGTFALYTGSGYLYAASSSKNYLRTETTLTDNSSWTIEIADGVATITAQGSNTRNLLQYNPNSGSPIFSTYGSAQQAIAIYKTSSACTNHELKEAKTFAPTCTADGYTLKVCFNCGATNKADVSGKVEHDYSVTKEEKAPTCMETGYTTMQCANCDATKTTTINALGHNFVDGECTREGCDEIESTTTEPTTVSVTIKDKNWTNSTKYTELMMDNYITVTPSSGTNTGKYYTSGYEWRMYQSEKATVTVKATSGKTIISVKISYNTSNSGILQYNGTNISSGTLVTVNADSITFTVGNSGTKTNGQVKITSIEVVYK